MKSDQKFTVIKLIYNPNSTGDAPELARKAAAQLRRKLGSIKVQLMPTKYPGHAEEIAYTVAKRYKYPLIVSVSGDGGYNEVVNGVCRAQDDGVAGSPVLSVIGAGNANDHYNALNYRPLPEAIKGTPLTIDLLKITLSQGKTRTVRYAHSYAGVGITPRIGEELNRHKLNPLKEVRIITRAMFVDRPVRIKHKDTVRRIESLLFANIVRMAKVLTLDDSNSLHDGKFEVIEIVYANRLRLLGTLLKAAVFKLKNQPKHSTYSFTACEDMPLQLDGEILQCKTDTRVDVGAAKDAIAILR